MVWGDIVSEAWPFGGQHQACCRINCLEPPEEYTGELRGSSKDAEHAAAMQALLAHREEVAGLQAATLHRSAATTRWVS